MLITVYVEELRTKKDRTRTELVGASAEYEPVNYLRSIVFDMPIREAACYHIGQKLLIEITPVKEA